MLATVPVVPRAFRQTPVAAPTNLADMVALVNHEITVNLISRAIYAIGGR